MKKIITRNEGYFKVIPLYSDFSNNYEILPFLDDRLNEIRIVVREIKSHQIKGISFDINKGSDSLKDFDKFVNKQATVPPSKTEFPSIYPLQSLEDGDYQIIIYEVKNDTPTKIGTVNFQIASDADIKQIQLHRPGIESTDDEAFWRSISKLQLNFERYRNFIEIILCREVDAKFWRGNGQHNYTRDTYNKRSSFISTDEYNLIKFGTELFMLKESQLDSVGLDNYLYSRQTLPYFNHVFESYNELVDDYYKNEEGDFKERVNDRLKNPFFIELIWNYWMEQGMLVQTFNLIALRFQNLNVGNNPLMRFNTDSLRPASHILWGCIQDEQHRLSLPRRVQEYDHEYGLRLTGKAVPQFTAADSRSKFLEAFNNLLTLASIFYKEADDTTRIADAFPVLNSLREVHLLLAEGNHNAYGNLTWTARHEMMIQQYILSREEMREFLGGRPMVPYPERWMDRVDSVRAMMGWGSTSITYFYDLATHGEKILLSIRYGDWSEANMPTASAANWALAFRDSIQKYIHAYRTVTGADLSANAFNGKEFDLSLNTNGNDVRNIQPAMLIQRRMETEAAKNGVGQRQAIPKQ